MSTDAEVVGGSARLEDPIEAANHYFDYLDQHQMGLHGGGSGTNPDTDADTYPDTYADADTYADTDTYADADTYAYTDAKTIHGRRDYHFWFI